MNYNQDKIDETVLATLLLTLHDGNRAWKGHSFEVLDRLYEKGYIYNSKGKTKSISFTEEGLTKAQEIFDKLFINWCYALYAIFKQFKPWTPFSLKLEMTMSQFFLVSTLKWI